MSVLKNKRRTSKIEYEKNFLGFYEYMMNLLDHIPRRWQKPLGAPMKEALNQMYDDVLMVSEMYIEKERSKTRFTQCRKVIEELFEDKRLRDLMMGIIESYQLADILKIEDPQIREQEIQSLLRHEKVGICLGSQISQVTALLVPDKFDHFVKDYLGIEFYIRHMDDGIILLNDKEELERIKGLLTEEAAKYGLTLHPKKTCVVKLTKGFTFLKVRYHVSGNKTIKTLAKSGIVRMRRKMKKFRGMIGRTKLKADDVYASIQSWIAHARVASSYYAVKAMLALYDMMYEGYRLTRRYWKRNEDLHRKRKVVRI